MKINWISRQNIIDFYLDELQKGNALSPEIEEMLLDLTK